MINAYPEYGKAILQFFKQKVAQGDCSTFLKVLTPGNLKKESIRKLKLPISPKDIKAIQDFSGKYDEAADWVRVFNKSKAEDFKTLANFLKGETEETALENLEFLAWLLDFSPRPVNDWNEHYNRTILKAKPNETENEGPRGKMGSGSSPNNSPDQNLAADPEPKSIVGIVPTEPSEKFIGGVNSEPVLPPYSKGQPWKKYLRQPAAWGTGILLALGIGTYSYLDKKEDPAYSLLPSTGCMYWTGEQYTAIPCNQRKEDALIIALDTARLRNFRRITRPDTITYQAIGHVWYIKRNNALEYYTAGGKHPEDPNKNLRPITKYMIDKYLRNIHSGSNSTAKGEAKPKSSP